jgi:putative endopeptidase
VKIAEVTDLPSLMRVLGEFHAQAIDAAFSLTTYIGPGSSLTEPLFDHVTLPLAEKDAYLRDDPASREIRDAYRKHIARLLALSGASDTDAGAAKIVALETELAADKRSAKTSLTSAA